MYTILDWLECHDFDESAIGFILAGSASDGLPGRPDWFAEIDFVSDPFALRLGDRQVCFQSIVRPAFTRFFGGDERVAAALDGIEFAPADPEAEALPYTLDRGPDTAPLVVMDWAGTAQSLLCLAHETTHALQIAFSQHAFMPPVAREVCAALGELVLIDWARAVEPEIASALVAVWDMEAERYLGEDADRLADALGEVDAAYHYRLNYPLARLAAVEMFGALAPDRLLDLFRSGGEAMTRLPVEVLADRARAHLNDLPAFADPAGADAIAEVYRTLGAMTLLDMDADRDAAAEPVEGYLAARRAEIDAGAVFVALAEDRRPMGYAVWSAAKAGAGPVQVVRRSLPYCSAATLDAALTAHLGAMADLGRPESAA